MHQRFTESDRWILPIEYKQISTETYVDILGVSSKRLVFKQLLGDISNFSFSLGFVKFLSEFSKRCFWVFRLLGGFLSTYAKPEKM